MREFRDAPVAPRNRLPEWRRIEMKLMERGMERRGEARTRGVRCERRAGVEVRASDVAGSRCGAPPGAEDFADPRPTSKTATRQQGNNRPIVATDWHKIGPRIVARLRQWTYAKVPVACRLIR